MTATDAPTDIPKKLSTDAFPDADSSMTTPTVAALSIVITGE